MAFPERESASRSGDQATGGIALRHVNQLTLVNVAKIYDMWHIVDNAHTESSCAI
ncbi:hypothetical protein L798_10517 [Zootermopsis nevadensis]|uniref:Uncharacterized protein n=1 Tax=Zootermopsis nevadensis TaxID=136037 RepID=A0A067QYX2_ZOONE|nr:hypothetical protein L798_10517 [Zootermopsis nevadensis]